MNKNKNYTVSVLIPAFNEEKYIINQIIKGVKVDHFETVRLHKNGNHDFAHNFLSSI